MPAELTDEMKTLLDSIIIDHASHHEDKREAEEKKLCVMEAAAFIADEPHSDSPVCVSGIVTSFLIAINDTRLQRTEGGANEDPAAERAKLKEVIPEILNTCPTEPGTIKRWSAKQQEYIGLPGVVRVENEAYRDAEQARRHHLAKSLREINALTEDYASSVADHSKYGDLHPDEVIDEYMDAIRIPTDDAIRITREMVSIG